MCAPISGLTNGATDAWLPLYEWRWSDAEPKAIPSSVLRARSWWTSSREKQSIPNQKRAVVAL